MDELRFAAMVEELAARTGHAVPPITRIDGRPTEQCIWLEPPGPVGPMLFVHEHVDEELPGPVQEFAVAQEFVQANLDFFARRRWVARCAGLVEAIVFVAVAVGPLLMFRGNPLDRNWLLLLFLVSLPVAYLLGKAGAVLVLHLWLRRLLRAIDRVLVDVLGRERLLEALRWHRDQHRSGVLSWREYHLLWLRSGAPPRSWTRLRWLSSDTD